MQPLSESLNRTWANAYTRIENSDFDQIMRKVHILIYIIIITLIKNALAIQLALYNNVIKLSI